MPIIRKTRFKLYTCLFFAQTTFDSDSSSNSDLTIKLYPSYFHKLPSPLSFSINSRLDSILLSNRKLMKLYLTKRFNPHCKKRKRRRERLGIVRGRGWRMRPAGDLCTAHSIKSVKLFNLCAAHNTNELLTSILDLAQLAMS